jgi:hypothetical protein
MLLHIFIFAVAFFEIRPKTTKEKDNTEDTIKMIKDFVRSKTYNKNKLDDIITQGRMGGFYFAVDFYQIITELHYEFPDLLSDFIVIGRTFQNRELKAFKLGDLGKLKRKQRKKISYSFYGFTSFS